MRISDWSSDVGSSDLFEKDEDPAAHALFRSSQRALKDSLFDGIDFTRMRRVFDYGCGHAADLCGLARRHPHLQLQGYTISAGQVQVGRERIARLGLGDRVRRSEEHTSELQSLMRISYAVFCLKKQKHN